MKIKIETVSGLSLQARITKLLRAAETCTRIDADSYIKDCVRSILDNSIVTFDGKTINEFTLNGQKAEVR